MNKTPIVITTVNNPTKGEIEFAQQSNFFVYIVADSKTPTEWHLKNTKFISINFQDKYYHDFSRLIKKNHYARKNIGYLEAIKSGAEYIYETDDDNIPYNFFPNFITDKSKLIEISSGQFFNIYQLFTDKKIWPRGTPLNKIYNQKYLKQTKKIRPLIQQSLIDLDPDVDAIYRLTIGEKVKFKPKKIYALAKGSYCPFNSQNTQWHRDIFPLLYLPSTVNSRVTDIWRGFIAQRIIWELDSRLIFLSPSVYQVRNKHNLTKDFSDELDLYLKTEHLIKVLEKIKLKGRIDEMMLTIYKGLIKNNFFEKEELKILKTWLKEIRI